MEPAAAWVPWDLQMANWTMDPTAVWAPGIPVEYASTETFGSCHQTSVPARSKGEQVVEYGAATQNDHIEKAAQEFVVDFNSMEMKIQDPIHVFQEAAHEFKEDINMVEKKIHRYPAMIRALGDQYTVPTTVAIGPYHHYQEHLKQAEKVKHVAAYHCIRESGCSVEEMYGAVVSVGNDARRLYDKDVMAGISDNEFLPMMFYDACFLVQYMLSCIPSDIAEMDPSLRGFIESNENDIDHDVMLLDNQLPWLVVKAILRFRPVPLEALHNSLKGCLQDRKDNKENAFVLDDGYEPPHLLGLLRLFVVGRSKANLKPPNETESISVSVSAIELAEIGITLKANETTELIDMGVKKNGTLFSELHLPPLSLNRSRANWLVNMAALELCTMSYRDDIEDEYSAVCSYLLLLAMFVDREEDVHELRKKHLLQGGGGFTNTETLEFFTSLQDLPLGSSYVRIMKEIENYKINRPVRTKVHAFVYKNKKTIVMFFSGIGALVSIIGTLKSLKVD
ncbi:hypothetical protein C2845_PM17G14760 [Panicum miliaceum]|uniref:Uncharacterized protein n=1 Tax=Panicum miliaceum TaxID=4540 RepID=A0A3L6Q2X5_PANMI|nr:hypothetical protein C2845_PM17G14760 [Panicum miliaceum]